MSNGQLWLLVAILCLPRREAAAQADVEGGRVISVAPLGHANAGLSGDLAMGARWAGVLSAGATLDADVPLPDARADSAVGIGSRLAKASAMGVLIGAAAGLLVSSVGDGDERKVFAGALIGGSFGVMWTLLTHYRPAVRPST